MRKAALYVGLAAAALYFSATAALWASQSRFIFEPVRTLVVKPGELGFEETDVMLRVFIDLSLLHLLLDLLNLLRKTHR